MPETPLSNKPARTQKGIGLTVLRGIYDANTLPIHAILQDPADLANWSTYPIFARPAPSTPKHGYIDSRVIESVDKLEQLLKQVLADDPGGELLLCPHQAALYNTVWTPTSLVIGRGHDGATAGKRTVSIPLAGVSPFDQDSLASARVSPDQDPYVEAVILNYTGSHSYNSGGFYTPSEVVLTQLRAGPRIGSRGGDYIPTLTEIQKVIRADPAKFKDRDWELAIAQSAGEPGLVVWHPGGAMTDHFSIHAFTHQIPILFGQVEPVVGSVLEPNTETNSAFDPSDMLLGLIAGEKIKLTCPPGSANVGSAVSALLLALHNSTACTGESSRWIGFAAAIMLRLGVTALRGEARHLHLTKTKLDRQTIYKASLPASLTRHRAGVTRLVNIFRYGAWNEGGSFGGIKWAYCGAATVALFNAVRDLARERSPESAAALVRALNLAVNQAHNGGWWLNKFANQSAFTLIPQASLPWVNDAAPTLYVGGKICEALSKRGINSAIEKIASWPVTDLKPPKVSSVHLTYQQGINSIGLRISSRLLGAKGKMIIASPGKVIETLETLVGDCTFLVETEDGYRVEIRPPEKEAIILWQDESLANAATEASLK